MQRKRFRVVKDGEKPLQTKTTNVKTPASDPLLKSLPSKKPAAISKKRRASPSESTEKKRKCQPSTLFDSEDVQIKVVDPESELLKRINGARYAESEVDDKSPHGRLTPVREEEDSLKIEDFDQPPQSTSTPVLLSSHVSPENENYDSPFLMNQPGFMSPVLYQPSAYPYTGNGQLGPERRSPFMTRQFMEQDGYPAQFTAGNYQCTPLQLPLTGRPLDDSYLRGYHPHVGSISEQDPHYQAMYPVDNVVYPPQLYLRNQLPVSYRDAVFPSSSNTGSYKSSGGEATYPDSNQSLKRGAGGGN